MIVASSKIQFQAVNARDVHLRSDDRDADFSVERGNIPFHVDLADRDRSDEDFRRILNLKSFHAVLSTERNTHFARGQTEGESDDFGVEYPLERIQSPEIRTEDCIKLLLRDLVRSGSDWLAREEVQSRNGIAIQVPARDHCVEHIRVNQVTIDELDIVAAVESGRFKHPVRSDLGPKSAQEAIEVRGLGKDTRIGLITIIREKAIAAA